MGQATETKHTPGPWEVSGPIETGSEYSICKYLGDDEGTKYLIASVYPIKDLPGKRHCDEALANARLIAEAPRLRFELAALVEACEALPATDARVVGLLPLITRARKRLDWLAKGRDIPDRSCPECGSLNPCPHP